MGNDTKITQKELILMYVSEYGEIVPAKISGKIYMNIMFGSETDRRCRELFAERKLARYREKKFTKYYLPL